jgi:hypothetical protein
VTKRVPAAVATSRAAGPERASAADVLARVVLMIESRKKTEKLSAASS